jgi:hypothetical protein
VQGIGSGGSAAAVQGGSAGRWQPVQGVGSGSTAAAAVQGLRCAGHLAATAAAAQPQPQCRACAVQGLWERQRSTAVAAAAQLGSSRAGRWQRQRSSGQCRALEAAAQQRAVQALAALRRQHCGCFIDSGSAATAAQRPTFTSAVQGVDSGSTAAAAVQGLRCAGPLASAGSWQLQHSSSAQRRQHRALAAAAAQLQCRAFAAAALLDHALGLI